MPFSKYIIQPDETGVTGAIASSCVQLLEAPSSVVLHHSGTLCLALRLSMEFSFSDELFTMPIQILKCKLQLILSGATQEVSIASYIMHLSSCSIKSAETRHNKNFIQKIVKM